MLGWIEASPEIDSRGGNSGESSAEEFLRPELLAVPADQQNDHSLLPTLHLENQQLKHASRPSPHSYMGAQLNSSLHLHLH